LFGPTLKDLFNAEALDSVEFFILQIRIMDEFSDSQDRSIADAESLDQRFESAGVSMMAEFHLKHVVGYSFRSCGRRVRTHEFRSRVDKLSDQPCRTHPIDFRLRASDPGFTAKILNSKSSFGLGFLFRGSE